VKIARHRVPAAACLLLTLVLTAHPASADEMDTAQLLSGEFYGGYVAAGVALPLLTGDADGESSALRTADALLTAFVATEALKHLASSERPNGAGDDSFPSGHAVATFAVAAMQSDRHPEQAALWYAGAAAISASRVKRKQHRVLDVLAGAALGYGIAQLELGSEDGLLLSPFLESEGDGFGVQLTWSP
jgi:membrane-associated phospholipid phosphatase